MSPLVQNFILSGLKFKIETMKHRHTETRLINWINSDSKELKIYQIIMDGVV